MVVCLGLGLVFCLLALPGKEAASAPGLALWQKPAAPQPFQERVDMKHGQLPFSPYDGRFGAVPTAGLFHPC